MKALVEFQLESSSILIQCTEQQKISDICKSYVSKAKLNENEIIYSYNGKSGSLFDKNLTFNEIANSFDKERKKMIIVVTKQSKNEEKIIKSKYVICPLCKEISKMEIKNYKINIFGCKNNHTKYNIPLKDFEKTQMINLADIKCNVCKNKDKSTTYNNIFYRCNECNYNLCPLCKQSHNENHIIIDYDKINYFCSKHNDPFINYCNSCEKNICFFCEDEHTNHEIISLKKMMFEKYILNNKKEELKKSIEIFNNNINKIIEILINVKENIEYYYKIEENIINNYNIKERNYILLFNINQIINNNIAQDIINFNNDNNYKNKFNNIFNIYEQINQVNNKIYEVINTKNQINNKNIDNDKNKIILTKCINNKQIIQMEQKSQKIQPEKNQLNIIREINSSHQCEAKKVRSIKEIKPAIQIKDHSIVDLENKEEDIEEGSPKNIKQKQLVIPLEFKENIIKDIEPEITSNIRPLINTNIKTVNNIQPVITKNIEPVI